MRRKEGMGRELCVHQTYCRELKSISVICPRAFKILLNKSKTFSYLLSLNIFNSYSMCKRYDSATILGEYFKHSRICMTVRAVVIR